MIYRLFDRDVALKFGREARQFEWSEGKARTKALTGTVKKNKEILTHPILNRFAEVILKSPAIQLDHLPAKIYGPKFSRCDVDDGYDWHTDAPWMATVRTDLSFTLWLSEFEGGELNINGQQVKGRPGELFVYDCGEHHKVEPVTAGTRIVAVGWIQSKIRSRQKRRLVSEYREFLRSIEDDHELFRRGAKFHSALLRMWSE